MQTERIDYLDSVRGLAAFAVLIYHFIASHWGWHTSMKVACMFFNGSDSVALFFVLSGLVLSLKYLQIPSNQPIVFNFPKYIFARIFRLYPAFLSMLVVYYLVAHRDKLGWDFLIDTILNKYYLFEEALLIRDYHNLFLPDWTLGIEMAMSLLLPFLILLIRHDEKMFYYFMLVVLIIGKGYITFFVLHFCFGLLIAKKYNQIKSYDFVKSPYYKFRYLIYIALFFAFGIRHFVGIYPFGNTWNYFTINILNLDLFHCTGIAAAFILLVIINNKKINEFLMIRPLLFLGKISYSLYLTHWLIISQFIGNWDYFFQFFPSEKKMFLFGLLITVSISLVASTLLYYLVEKPFINIGRNLSNRFFPA